MPTTPGLPRQGRPPYVAAEAAMLHARLPGSVLLLEPEPGNLSVADELPTKANVLTYVPSCTIAHFACHGYTNPVDPSQSLLLLHDYQRDPLNVAALAARCTRRVPCSMKNRILWNAPASQSTE